MPAGAAEDFVAKCRQLKLDFVVFVRHASSAPLYEGAAKRSEKPHDWKIDDQMRVLTQKGKDQCAAATWFRELDVRAALTSPALWKSNFYGAFVLNCRVVLHAIDATEPAWPRTRHTG